MVDSKCDHKVCLTKPQQNSSLFNTVARGDLKDIKTAK